MSRRWWTILLATSFLMLQMWACDDGGADGDADGDSDGDSDGDGDGDGDGDSDSDGDGDADGDGDGDTDCGNDLCEDDEDAESCPEDCEALCPDGLCTHDEDAESCPEDCAALCPDSFCTHDEDAQSCPDDCSPVCGDGFCTHDEGAGSCLEDCPVECEPDTCDSLGVTCGTADDGCGETLSCGPPCPLQECEDWADGWSCVDLSPTLCTCSCSAWGSLPGTAPRIECELTDINQVYCTCTTGGEAGDRESTSVSISTAGVSCDMAQAQFDSDFCGLVP